MRTPSDDVSLSAVIVACNEASRVAEAVRSATPWVDEVLVVDGGSRDATEKIAAREGARVISYPWDGYIRQKQRGVDAASHSWIVSLDADERIGSELGAALRDAARSLDAEGEFGARVRRVNYLDGKAIGASGWRDRPVRLFDRRFARWGGRDPHDRVVGVRNPPLLPGVLHHDPDRTMRQYIRGTVRHARTKSISLAAAGRPGPLAPALHGLGHWVRKMAAGAPADGRRGWAIAWVGACGTARAYRLARRNT